MFKLPPYATFGDRIWDIVYKLICASVYLFLIAPILVIIPLSFNSQPYFTFTPEMLMLNPEAFSFRWYIDLLENEQWARAIRNSFVIGIFSTLLATTLGTIAALGLSKSNMPGRTAVMLVLTVSNDRSGNHYGSGDVFFLYEHWAWSNVPRTDPGAYSARHTIRSNYSNGDSVGF